MWSLYILTIVFASLHGINTADLPILKNLNFFMDKNPNASMQRIVIHNVTREVFVGARNAIYHFDDNLSIKRKVSTGPELDHVECLHPSIPCEQKRVESDNDNKILDIYYATPIDVLFACGSLYQGMCRAMPVSNINVHEWIGHFNNSRNFIAGKESTVGFFAPGPTPGLSLYSAATYDNRPLSYSPVTVSSKIPIWDNDSITFVYTYESEIFHTGVNFSPIYKKIYKVNYIYGFSYNGFSYFVTTQQIAPESDVIETRLVRVCQDDRPFFSYMEVALRCQRGLDVYNLATAAHLGPAGVQLKRKLKMSADVNEILYVSFGMTIPDHGTVLDYSKGSVVCSFPMDQVIESFDNAINECFQAEPRTHLLKHVIGVDKKCDKQEVEHASCGSGLNPYIEGRESIPGGFRFHLDQHLTSLAVTLQYGKTIAAMGTSNGEVVKAEL